MEKLRTKKFGPLGPPGTGEFTRLAQSRKHRPNLVNSTVDAQMKINTWKREKNGRQFL